MQLSDAQFVSQFENLSLDCIHFNHVGHLRLCWLYLRQFDLETAVEKTCSGIQSYATSLGAKDKFHRTITEFLVRMIYKRNTLHQSTTFEEFLQHNDDLVKDALNLLGQYYSKELLESPTARINYVKPDLTQSSL